MCSNDNRGTAFAYDTAVPKELVMNSSRGCLVQCAADVIKNENALARVDGSSQCL
jgi:hypothetical protein